MLNKSIHTSSLLSLFFFRCDAWLPSPQQFAPACQVGYVLGYHSALMPRRICIWSGAWPIHQNRYFCEESRQRDLNPQPIDYKSIALPLRYGGKTAVFIFRRPPFPFDKLLRDLLYVSGEGFIYLGYAGSRTLPTNTIRASLTSLSFYETQWGKEVSNLLKRLFKFFTSSLLVIETFTQRLITWKGRSEMFFCFISYIYYIKNF